MADFVTERKPCLSCGQTIDSRSVRCMHCLKEVESGKPIREGVASRSKIFLIATFTVTAVGGYGIYQDLRPKVPLPVPAYTLKELDKKFEGDKATDVDDGQTQSYYNQQKMNETISEWTRAIEKNPKDANAFLERGWGYNDLQQYENAEYDLSRAIALKPHWSEAYCKRAWVHNTRGDYQKAIADAGRAIRYDPKNSEAYEARASAYASLGDSAHAKLDSAKSENITLQLNN